MELVKTRGKVKNLMRRIRYFVTYRSGLTAYMGHTSDLYAVAISTATANVLVGIRASTSGYVAFPGSTTGTGSNASFMYSKDMIVGVPKSTIEAGTFGWFQTGGTATCLFASGATLAAGYHVQMITAGKTVNMTALNAAYSGYPYQIAIAQEAIEPATYGCFFLDANTTKKALLTT